MWTDQLWTLAAVITGGALTTGIETWKNRLSRSEKNQALAVSRAEEAVEICEQMLRWTGETLDIAKTGLLTNNDPPRFYRLAAIAATWAPELAPQMEGLHKALYGLANAANFQIAIPIRNHQAGGPTAAQYEAYQDATTAAATKVSQAAKAAVLALKRLAPSG